MNETSPLRPLSPTRLPRSSPVRGPAQMSFDSRTGPLAASNGFPSDSASSTADESEERSVKFDIMDDDDDDDDEEPILLEVKNEEVLRRVSEMRRMVASAENYLSEEKATTPLELQSESTSSDEREMDGSLEPRGTIKAADSLLLLTQLDDVSEAVNEVVVPDEASPSESDTDSFSTPNQSPLHRTSRLAGANDTGTPPPARTRSGSSFGLHSPDMLPGIGSSDRDLLELLKQLQSNPEIQLPFAEGTLYLDPDIIDLTMIPPPMTPDMELCDSPGTLDVPPTPFSDRGLPFRQNVSEVDAGEQNEAFCRALW